MNIHLVVILNLFVRKVNYYAQYSTGTSHVFYFISLEAS